MYEQFYNLRERPFALTPDPEYLYPSRVHREALFYLRYGLEHQAGFIAITGEIGSGKTTLLQTMLRDLDSETTVGRIVNTLLDPRELIEMIMIAFGLDPSGRSKPLLLRDLASYLSEQRRLNRTVLLVIDEAQNLSVATLEELRMLSNLENDNSKLLRVILAGQPTLRDKIGSPELEQLRQRITVSYHLRSLDAEETANYINHRLRLASLGTPLEFSGEVTDMVHARTGGVPRMINVICDVALVFGYAEQQRQIDLPLLGDALAELESTGVLSATGSDAARRAAPDTVGDPPPDGRAGRVEGTVGSTPTEDRAPVDALAQREATLARRERELAEQRRVLAEEYRLLRSQLAPGAPPVAPRSPASALTTQFEGAEGWFARLKRVLLGAPERTAE